VVERRNVKSSLSATKSAESGKRSARTSTG
jgi:hypothetical protein